MARTGTAWICGQRQIEAAQALGGCACGGQEAWGLAPGVVVHLGGAAEKGAGREGAGRAPVRCSA